MRQVRVEGHWNHTPAELGLQVDRGATESARRGAGHLAFGRPHDRGLRPNPVDGLTPRKALTVLNGVRANHLGPGNLIPVPSKALRSTQNGPDADYTAVDERTGVVWEAITWQPPTPWAFWDPLRNKYRASKAVRWVEGATEGRPGSWPLPPGHQSSAISGFPKWSLAMRADNLGLNAPHALAIAVPPQHILAPQYGTVALANGATCTDGLCVTPTNGCLVMGARFLLDPDIDLEGCGDLTIEAIEAMQTMGVLLIMSGDPNGGISLVVEGGQFTKADKVRWNGIERLTLNQFQVMS